MKRAGYYQKLFFIIHPESTQLPLSHKGLLALSSYYQHDINPRRGSTPYGAAMDSIHIYYVCQEKNNICFIFLLIIQAK